VWCSDIVKLESGGKRRSQFCLVSVALLEILIECK
jgi:hypothetical protein